MTKYDKEFKKETVKKYLDGQSVASISREIGVNENTIHKWKKEILSVNGEIDQEKLAMRKRVIELEMENEILKKAALIKGCGSWCAINSLTKKRRIIRSNYCAG